MKKTLYVFISLITTYMLLFEKNVYALETSKIFSDEINMIIVMGLLWCNIIIMVIKETRRRKWQSSFSFYFFFYRKNISFFDMQFLEKKIFLYPYSNAYNWNCILKLWWYNKLRT